MKTKISVQKLHMNATILIYMSILSTSALFLIIISVSFAESAVVLVSESTSDALIADSANLPPYS